MVRSAYHGYQGVLNTSLGAGIRYGYGAANVADFGYNLAGGDGIIPVSLGGVAGGVLNGTIGATVGDEYNPAYRMLRLER